MSDLVFKDELGEKMYDAMASHGDMPALAWDYLPVEDQLSWQSATEEVLSWAFSSAFDLLDVKVAYDAYCISQLRQGGMELPAWDDLDGRVKMNIRAGLKAGLVGTLEEDLGV